VWMVNMIKILVLRLRESNNRLRGIVEQYTPPPVDTGSVLTIDEDSTGAAAEHTGDSKCTGKAPLTFDKRFRSDEILEELFEPVAGPKKQL